jgi:predicted HTH transcriptional regulator
MNNIITDINSLLLDKYLLYDTFSHPEGTQLEFKKTFHINQLEKYRQTICALLNTNGGHIIFGVSNDCSITGCNIKQTEIDSVMLFVDSLYEILKKTDGNHLDKNTLKVRIDEIAKSIYIIFISCYREENATYQFLSGESWIRINASNRKSNLSKLHSIQDIVMIKNKLEIFHNQKIQNVVIEVGNILNKKNVIDTQKLKKSLVMYKKLYNYNKIVSIVLIIMSGCLLYKIQNFN